MSTPMAIPTETVAVPHTDRLAAHVCLAVAITLLRLPFRHVIAIVTRLQLRTPRLATRADATRMAAAVQAATRHQPGRAACLERSLAATLLAIARRRRVDWCIGARLLPYTGHAWIEVAGHPVGEPTNPDRPYHRMRRI